MGRLVLNAIEIGGDPGIAAFGLLLKPTVHGFLGYATLTARDIREALAVTQRYFRMRNRQYRLTYAEDERGATLELHGVQASPVLQHHVMFEFVLTAAQNISQWAGRESPPIKLQFAWPEPPYFARYRDQPPVEFGCAANALWIARDVLDWPLPLADEVAHRQALVQVEREYAQVRQEEGDLVERVRAELARGPAITRDRRRSPTRCSCRPARCGAGLRTPVRAIGNCSTKRGFATRSSCSPRRIST